MNINLLKQKAADKAVEEIKSGMIVGLGSGSTSQFALEALSKKLNSGELKDIIGIPTSITTENEAKRLGIPVISLNEACLNAELRMKNAELRIQNSEFYNQHSAFKVIDITIDGADEIDEKLNLIKGGGGAHLREKIIAQASKELYIIVDESKISKKLGEKWHVPVEILQFSFNAEKKYLESLGAKVGLRKKSSGETFITDEGNFILDADFGVIENPAELSSKLNERAGIVEHGLFVNMAAKVFCSLSNGEVKIIKC